MIFTAVVGWWFYRGEFWVNLLAEGAGLFASIIVAITMVEYLTRKHREAQWERVKDLTLRSICTHIVEFQTTFMLLDLHPHHDLVMKIIDGRAQASQEAAKAMFASLDPIRQYFHTRVRRDEDALMRDIDDLYRRTRWDLGQIREVLMPRVMQISEDPELIEVLVDFDEAYRQWEHTRIADQQAGIGYGQVFEAAVQTFEAGAKVYQFIAQRYMKLIN